MIALSRYQFSIRIEYSQIEGNHMMLMLFRKHALLLQTSTKNSQNLNSNIDRQTGQRKHKNITVYDK